MIRQAHPIPLAMGALMGIMMPIALHAQEWAAAIAAFLLAHLGVAVLAVCAVWWFRAHRSGNNPALAAVTKHAAHVPWMIAGAALGFVLLHFTAELGGMH